MSIEVQGILIDLNIALLNDPNYLYEKASQFSNSVDAITEFYSKLLEVI